MDKRIVTEIEVSDPTMTGTLAEDVLCGHILIYDPVHDVWSRANLGLPADEGDLYRIAYTNGRKGETIPLTRRMWPK